MNLYARYIGFVYFKAFLIVFLSLLLFYVGIDLLTNLKDLPKSANTQLLYVGMTALTAVSYVLPISLVFGIIIAQINMVRQNELVSLYALGISKNSFILPPFFISIIITLCLIALNFTPFAYAQNYQRLIFKGLNFAQNTNDTFVKFDKKFIYIKELNSLNQTMQDVVIFDINQTELNGVAFAKSAKFLGDEWSLSEANVTILPKILKVGEAGLEISNKTELNTLKNFTPKSIVSASSSEKTSLNALDALDFISTFKDEGTSLNTAKSTLYSLVFAPLFAPLLLLIIYYHLPVSGRFFNLAISSFICVLATLIFWGISFVLAKFSSSGVIFAEIGILLPVILLFIYAFYLFKRHC